MLSRKILTRLPKLTIRNCTGPFKSDDLSKMALSYNDTRIRPYILPRSTFSIIPRFGRRYEDDFFSDFDHFFDRSVSPIRPERMFRELEDLARIATAFQDVPYRIKYNGPRRSVAKSRANEERKHSSEDSGTEMEQNESKNFAVQVRAGEFKPEEIAVRVRDGYVTVEAEKEEKDVESGSYKYQQIRKRFLLPSNVDPDTIDCEMTKDGYLVIQAQCLEPSHLETAKRIPIKNAAEPTESREKSKENSTENTESNKTDS